MFNKDDIIIIIPAGTGYIVTTSNDMDGFWLDENNREIQFRFENKSSDLAAFTSIGDLLMFIANLHYPSLSETFVDMCCEPSLQIAKYQEEGINDSEIKNQNNDKKKEKRKTPNIGNFGENLRIIEKVREKEVGIGKKPKKAKRTTKTTKENTCLDTELTKPKKTLKNALRKVAQKYDLTKPDIIGYYCDDCGETYEKKPERCVKCNSYSIEVLGKEQDGRPVIY